MPIPRTYFAIPATNGVLSGNDTQVRYFFDLSYWLMSLADDSANNKPGQRKTASKPASARK